MRSARWGRRALGVGRMRVVPCLELVVVPSVGNSATFLAHVCLLCVWVNMHVCVAVLHSSDPLIIHRDLKSLNLLVDESWTVKVRIASSTCTPVGLFSLRIFFSPTSFLTVRGYVSTPAPCSQCTLVELCL